jgi:hypothetical protein
MSDLNLPEKLNLDAALSFESLVQKLYTVFRNDFIDTKPYFKALPVLYDNRRMDDSIYPEGFWHIITRGKDTRLLDYKRAKRLPWLRPLIQQAFHKELYTWSELRLDESLGHSSNTWYIWYKEGKYIAVLRERPGKYFLATAFYITGDYQEKRYLAKYEASKKKGTGG